MRLIRTVWIVGCLCLAVSPAWASLSASLGATDLRGLDDLTNCQRESVGFREGLIGDRLEQKLAQSPSLTAQERDVWMAEIQALKRAWQTHTAFVAPDPQNSQRYLLGLTDDEQVSINSLFLRFSQEVNLKCEQRFGGMTRYSPGSDQSGQRRYEDELRSQMGQAIDIRTIPITPLPSPFPKTREQMREEQNAKKQARQDAMKQKFTGCIDQTKGLRIKMLAQAMQKKLDASNLSGNARKEFEADVQSAWISAGKGLEVIEPADPKNPNRAMARLSAQELTDAMNEYVKEYQRVLQNCAR